MHAEMHSQLCGPPCMQACAPRYVTHHAQKVDVRSTCVTSGGNPALDLNHRRSLSTRETRQVGICNVWGEGGRAILRGAVAGLCFGGGCGQNMEAVYTANVTGKGPVWPPNEDQMVHGYMRQVSLKFPDPYRILVSSIARQASM